MGVAELVLPCLSQLGMGLPQPWQGVRFGQTPCTVPGKGLECEEHGRNPAVPSTSPGTKQLELFCPQGPTALCNLRVLVMPGCFSAPGLAMPTGLPWAVVKGAAVATATLSKGSALPKENYSVSTPTPPPFYYLGLSHFCYTGGLWVGEARLGEGEGLWILVE